MRSVIFFLLMMMMAWAGAAHADTKIGLTPGLVNCSINDPDGDTGAMDALVPLSLAFVYDLNNKKRLYTTLSYMEATSDAGTREIGQKVTAYQITSRWQHIIKLSHVLQFYAGVGVGYTQAEFRDRHTVDSDGYLGTRYQDRDESFFSAIGCLSREWQVSQRIDVGVDIAYQYDFTDKGLSGLKASIGVFYRF